MRSLESITHLFDGGWLYSSMEASYAAALDNNLGDHSSAENKSDSGMEKRIE